MKNLLSATALLLASTSFGYAEGSLQLFNWGNYTGPKLLEKFEKETGIKVTVTDYDSNDAALAKIEAGGSGFDLVVPTHQYVQIYAEKGLIQKLDLSKIPNHKNIAPEWMDVVDAAGHLVAGTRLDLLGNALVLVSHAPATPQEIGKEFDLKARLAGGKLAMALTEAVPAGQYGKAALQSVSLWDEVAADVAEADNVRAALALVALGEAPLGIVYATDARAEPRVHVAGWFAGESHKAIRYPVALLRRDGLAEQSDAARALFAALRAPAARAIFAAQGFTEVAP